MILSRTKLWRWLRKRKILAQHRQVAAICEKLISEYREHPVFFQFVPKVAFDTSKIIWQYWAQGFENIPETIQKCFESVDRQAQGYKIIRISDDTLSKYLDLPEFLITKRSMMSAAHFSDLLRLMLLKTYGGIWMDATILLTGPIPKAYAENEFFVFRRDPQDPNYRYWSNVYAYYWGWDKGFRVNMLSSFMVAKRGNRTVSELCDLMLLWWKKNDKSPDYFFLQILFDVYNVECDYILASDTFPHYLQQSINDPAFKLMNREDILKSIPIHKLTYKRET